MLEESIGLLLAKTIPLLTPSPKGLPKRLSSHFLKNYNIFPVTFSWPIVLGLNSKLITMKSFNFFFLVLLLTLGACNQTATNGEQEGETTATDTTAVGLTEVDPMDANDNFFFQALQAFEAGQTEEAANYLQSGINELKEEVATLEGEQKQNLETAIAGLESAKQQLVQGQIASANDLKQLIAGAEAYAPHKLLADMKMEGAAGQE